MFKTDRSVGKLTISKLQNFGNEVFVDIRYKKKPVDSNSVEYTNMFGLKKFANLTFNHVFVDKPKQAAEKAKNFPPRSGNEEYL